MNKELYFLRSSEQKIVNDMIKYAYPKDFKDTEKFTKHYALTSKDLGLYALVDGEIAGAIWSREIDFKPKMSVAVVPKFKKQGIGIFMMEQFLLEASAVYDEITVNIEHKPKAIKFYERFGFTTLSDYTLVKKLEKKELIRPTDGYDSSRWMD